MAHKYHAKATTVDGITFASKREASRYSELKLLQKAQQITDLELQPSYVLYGYDMSLSTRLRAAAANIRGDASFAEKRLKRLGLYIADFRYQAFVQGKWETIIEDVKGAKTPLYRWKKKHVEAQYGITITEVA